MTKNYCQSILLIFFWVLLSQCDTTKKDETKNNSLAKKVTLPNGWSITPAGKSIDLGDFPANLVASPSNKLLAVTNNGVVKQSITLIDAQGGKVLDDVTISSSWLGLAFSADEKKLYASAGNENKIIVYQIENQKLKKDTTIVLGEAWTRKKTVKISPAGLCVDDKNKKLYVVTKEDSSLYICDTEKLTVLDKKKLSSEPFTCILSPDSKELYISLWGGKKVLMYDTENQKFVSEAATESHPNDMTITKNGRYLFVSNGNVNTVSVIDVKNRKVMEILDAALYPNAPVGTTPNGVALSEDEKTLYIANADNNCLAVFDVSNIGNSKSKGFIPVGWYPTAVKVIANKIYVTNGKGMTSFANPKGPNPTDKEQNAPTKKSEGLRNPDIQYIGSLMKGSLSIIDVPDPQTLALYSKAVYNNTPYTKKKETEAEGEKGNPVPVKAGEKSPIKYVFYIIKENRTYDNVLGDVKEGNGDPTLCIFPEKLTPNQHALAKEFVLLDNFYVDAEVSADGHNWSMAAYANDYVERNWITSYGRRGGSYDFEGSRKIAYPENGFIWDFCKRAGITYRTYGEFTDFEDDNKASIEALVGHVAPNYPNFDMKVKDQFRESVWEKDLDSLIAADAVPAFSTIRLGNDHTSGLQPGAYTPEACVADNDYAVGKLIEHLSNSKIWKESAVFILEDDAQNGADHVDAHRSIAFVVSPYTKRNFIDHTMYSTSGMLRTMELILGLPPMSQYDAAATPLWRCFMPEPNFKPFKAILPNIDTDAKNVADNETSKKSVSLDLEREDQIPDMEFNQIIWKAMRGEHAVMPAPKRSAFVRID